MLLKLPFDTKNSKKLRLEFGKKLLIDLLNEQYSKRNRLEREEVYLRCTVFSHTDLDQWEIIWNYISELADREFQKTKSKQIDKFDRLLKSQKTDIGHNRLDTKDRIFNISHRVLSEEETNLLKKGLKFIPFQKKVDKLCIATSTELALNQAKSSDCTLISMLNDPRKITNLTGNNMSVKDIQALKSLQRDQDICIMEADKGKSVVIMDKAEYESKMDAIVYSEAYQQVQGDPSVETDRQIRNIVKELKKTPNVPRNIAYSLIGHNSRDPGIYGAPKVHKPNVPLRPIITTYGTTVENCARYIANILKHYQEVSTIQTSIKNSYELKSFFKSKSPPLHSLLVSFDVVNLFGSVPQDKCKQIIMDIVKEDRDFEDKFNIPLSYFEQLLDICISCSFFKYKGGFFVQQKGLPMGSSCSPVLADLYLRYLENRIFGLTSAKSIDFWKRYMDDIISLWCGTRRQLDIFLAEINRLDPSIKFTMELEDDGSLPFLDVRIKKDANKYHFSMYSKPTDSGIIMSFKSFQPPSIKSATIKAETIRYKALSDNEIGDLPKLKEKFLNNGYPEKMVSRAIEMYKPKISNGNLTQGDKTNLNLPYLGKLSQKIQKVAKRNNFRLTSSNVKSLGSLFAKNYKEKTSKETNLVYRIPCRCGEVYIGETCKTLDVRISQHKYDVKSKNMNNGLAAHVFNTGHTIDWNNADVLAYESNWKKRKIKEALFIQSLRPSINIYEGFRLVGDWSRLSFSN